ncbi:unnamed protein product, partial [marine sediment metagenome]
EVNDFYGFLFSLLLMGFFVMVLWIILLLSEVS